jgi:hypothetical protein
MTCRLTPGYEFVSRRANTHNDTRERRREREPPEILAKRYRASDLVSRREIAHFIRG